MSKQSNVGPVLANLAARINAEHDKATAALRDGLCHAIRAGELLLEAKAAVPHGQWLPWLKANCPIPERTAQLYMRVARKAPALAESAIVADLGLRDAAKLLAKPAAKDETAPEGSAADDVESPWTPPEPKPELIPPPDHMLVGVIAARNMRAWIIPSFHDGYYWVIVWTDFDGERSMVETAYRPVNQRYIDGMLRHCGFHAPMAAWSLEPTPPWPENFYYIP